MTEILILLQVITMMIFIYYLMTNNKSTQNNKVVIEKENIKDKIILSIYKIDYLNNIFISFLNDLKFQSKKSMDFKLILLLIYQGKHFIPEIKDFILFLVNNMNNFRLSTNKSIITNNYM